MKNYFYTLSLVGIIFFSSGCFSEKNESKESYLGQKPPGLKAEIFAPDIVSTDENDEYGFTLSAKTKELYFTRKFKNPRRDFIFSSKFTTKGLNIPEKVGFIKDDNIAEPMLSPNEDLFIFGKRLQDTILNTITPQVWYMKKEAAKWSKPRYLLDGMYASMDRDDNIYYTDISDGIQKSKIARAKFENNSIHETEVFSESINSQYQSAHPFVSPKGDFIIFDSERLDGFGSSDLYISFRKEIGWYTPQNLGEGINTENYEALPYLSPDGKYLFFTRVIDQGDIYWIDAKIIEELRPK